MGSIPIARSKSHSMFSSTLSPKYMPRETPTDDIRNYLSKKLREDRNDPKLLAWLLALREMEQDLGIRLERKEQQPRHPEQPTNFALELSPNPTGKFSKETKDALGKRGMQVIEVGNKSLYQMRVEGLPVGYVYPDPLLAHRVVPTQRLLSCQIIF